VGAEGYLAVGGDQDDGVAACIGNPEDEDLGHNVGYLLRCEVGDCQHETPDQLLAGVERGHLGARELDTAFAEVNPELVGGFRRV